MGDCRTKGKCRVGAVPQQVGGGGELGGSGRGSAEDWDDSRSSILNCYSIYSVGKVP